MNVQFDKKLNDLEHGREYVLEVRPDSVCYLNEDGYLCDDSLGINRRLMVSVKDRFKNYDPREYLTITKGERIKFYGNIVCVYWIDHSYVTIEFIGLKGNPKIIINRPMGEYQKGDYGWIDKLGCFEKLNGGGE